MVVDQNGSRAAQSCVGEGRELGRLGDLGTGRREHELPPRAATGVERLWRASQPDDMLKRSPHTASRIDTTTGRFHARAHEV